MERAAFRVWSLIFASALLHMMMLTALTGVIGGRMGVSRLPDVVTVSVVPRMGPFIEIKPESMRMENKQDELKFEVSARANVPEKVDEIALDRFSKERVSLPDPERPPDRSDSREQRLIVDNPDLDSRLDLAHGVLMDQDRKSIFHMPLSMDWPEVEQRPPFTYPELARQRGWEGSAEINIEVLPDGSVGDVYLEKSSGYLVLDEAAISWVKNWKFNPPSEPTRKIQPVRFKLSAVSPSL